MTGYVRVVEANNKTPLGSQSFAEQRATFTVTSEPHEYCFSDQLSVTNDRSLWCLMEMCDATVEDSVIVLN